LILKETPSWPLLASLAVVFLYMALGSLDGQFSLGAGCSCIPYIYRIGVVFLSSGKT